VGKRKVFINIKPSPIPTALCNWVRPCFGCVKRYSRVNSAESQRAAADATAAAAIVRCEPLGAAPRPAGGVMQEAYVAGVSVSAYRL